MADVAGWLLSLLLLLYVAVIAALCYACGYAMGRATRIRIVLLRWPRLTWREPLFTDARLHQEADKGAAVLQWQRSEKGRG